MLLHCLQQIYSIVPRQEIHKITEFSLESGSVDLPSAWRAADKPGADGQSIWLGVRDRFYPRAKRAMPVFQSIARAGKPILFHSGILWDGKDSARYNRPGEFEALVDIDGLKFCLAHISWPWCDELVAVYGKFLNARTRNRNVEMFVDTTPGTPVIFRREVLSKLFGSDYDVSRNIIFGTDCRANDYTDTWAREWIARDLEILSALHIEEKTVRAVFADNLQRFVGESDAVVEHKIPLPGR